MTGDAGPPLGRCVPCGGVGRAIGVYPRWERRKARLLASSMAAFMAGEYQGAGGLLFSGRGARDDRIDGATKRFGDRSSKVLDAGCGTGLVGVALRGAGYTELHGIDISPEMIERARERGIYRSLEAGIDLATPVPDHLMATADIVLVGGVFTVGHIPPEALEVVATLARPGGLLVVSTRASYHVDVGFRDVQRRLADDGLLQLLVHIAEAPYTMDSTGDYWAWRVIGA